MDFTELGRLVTNTQHAHHSHTVYTHIWHTNNPGIILTTTTPPTMATDRSDRSWMGGWKGGQARRKPKKNTRASTRREIEIVSAATTEGTLKRLARLLRYLTWARTRIWHTHTHIQIFLYKYAPCVCAYIFCRRLVRARAHTDRDPCCGRAAPVRLARGRMLTESQANERTTTYKCASERASEYQPVNISRRRRHC